MSVRLAWDPPNGADGFIADLGVGRESAFGGESLFHKRSIDDPAARATPLP